MSTDPLVFNLITLRYTVEIYLLNLPTPYILPLESILSELNLFVYNELDTSVLPTLKSPVPVNEMSLNPLFNNFIIPTLEFPLYVLNHPPTYRLLELSTTIDSTVELKPVPIPKLVFTVPLSFKLINLLYDVPVKVVNAPPK